MKFITKIVAVLGMVVAASAANATVNTKVANPDAAVKVGTLTCHFDKSVGWLIGSSKSASCTYSGLNGRKQAYTAHLTNIGVDVGVTSNQTLVWAVIAPGNISPKALNGTYVGVGADATVIGGVTANALVGGLQDSIALQPLSIGAQTGLNVAAGVRSMSIKAAK